MAPSGTISARARALLALALAPLGACAAPPAPPPPGEVSSPQESAGSIPDAPVSGKIRGAPFKMADARYFIDKRRGYEHVDIQLNASAAADTCGPLAADDLPTVWLRRKGALPVTAGEVRLTPKSQGPWEVHYQAKDHHGWVGNGDAAALVVIRAVRNDGALVGDLSVCFADSQKSCVSGSFVALHCPIRIDAPVRGIEVPETPAAYLRRHAASAAPAAPPAPAPSSSAAEAPSPDGTASGPKPRAPVAPGPQPTQGRSPR